MTYWTNTLDNGSIMENFKLSYCDTGGEGGMSSCNGSIGHSGEKSQELWGVCWEPLSYSGFIILSNSALVSLGESIHG